MLWGVRRQNPSGGHQSADSKAVAGLRGKKVSQLSNEELKKLNNRLQLERTYSSLTAKQTGPGAKFVGEILRETTKNTASSYIQKGMTKVVEAAFNYGKKALAK